MRNEDYIERAMNAYARTWEIDTPFPEAELSYEASAPYSRGIREYVVLVGEDEVLAVYRVNPDGRLSRDHKYPDSILTR